MKPSHLKTPRTLDECTFTELNAYTPHLQNPDRIVVWAAGIAFVVLMILMAAGVVR